jgi:hypothetical protein
MIVDANHFCITYFFKAILDSTTINKGMEIAIKEVNRRFDQRNKSVLNIVIPRTAVTARKRMFCF